MATLIQLNKSVDKPIVLLEVGSNKQWHIYDEDSTSWGEFITECGELFDKSDMGESSLSYWNDDSLFHGCQYCKKSYYSWKKVIYG